MYKQFFGLSENPFNMTPDSRFFFASEKHRSALDSVFYSITERKGFTVITGEVGSGKTTVCRTLLNRLDSKTKFAIIRNTLITPKELIVLTLEDLEVPYTPGSKAKLISQLNEYLAEQLALDYNVVLMIDEAQNLSFRALEEVRMLSNLETEREKLIQIVLFGQPQLRERLRTDDLEQLRQRIALYYHLEPLDMADTAQYMRHRIGVAGGTLEEIFTDEAVNVVYRYSQGIPRLINLICENALIGGYADNVKPIPEGLVREIAHSTILKEDLLFDSGNGGGNGGIKVRLFSLDLPNAQNVSIAGDFTGWKALPLARNKEGIWQRKIKLEPGRYQYRFLVDGEWFDETQIRQFIPNEYGTKNTVITVT
ncbi:MAG: AAA family ATPase [Candidatus Omnitrophica bacterium]|nr:AAA family ATPase [Candidatus Omnitrophota bacterium]